jgi:DNA helicase HerA-like ATPase
MVGGVGNERGSPVSMESELTAQVKGFRAARRNLEASVLSLATSVDGRRFSFQASLHGLQFQVGGYVVLDDGGAPRFGQVITLDLDRLSTELLLPAHAGGAPENRMQIPIQYARGDGTILEGDSAPFHEVPIRAATGAEVQGWLERKARPGAKLRLGELALAPGVPCLADADGFARHTFLCGQSGSGKTYSLGVILERLLVETELRLVILDPNSDFVRLGSVREGADPALAERYQGAARGVAVYSAGAPGERRLRVHGAELDPATQAAVLRVDPIADREEYAALAELLARPSRLALQALSDSDRPEERRLGLRFRNLGVDRFTVWAPDETGSVLDAVHDQGIRCVVVDLGSLPTREEQSLIAGTVLGNLWRRRQERKPVLIVIDEAHNICPADPPDQLVAQAAEHAIRIAAEGRKFGLYLLVSTQRPQKIAENVLSQADNLVLMRLNSLADTAFTQATFSFVPPSLIDRAITFYQGESLNAGRISPQPALLRFGTRITEEGGADVPATWAYAQGTRGLRAGEGS